MKKLYFLLFTILITSLSFGQTTLSAGDIIITSLISDGNDRFEFIPLVDLEIGTVIYFTESGWDATASTWRNMDLTEGCLSYTAPAAITKGTVISVEEDAIISNSILSPNDGSVIVNNFGGSWALSTNGDQVIAFQGTPPIGWDGTGTNPFPTPTFLFAVTSHSTSWHDATTTNETAIPTGLTEVTTAIALGSGSNSGDEYDNIYFDATTYPLTGKTRSEILALVGNTANWLGDNTVPTSWKISSFTLTAKENQIEGFRFSPNPTALGYVNISRRSQTAMKISVFDILGKQVINSTVFNNKLDVSNLNAGIYIMRVSQDNATTTKKLVIQ